MVMVRAVQAVGVFEDSNFRSFPVEMNIHFPRECPSQRHHFEIHMNPLLQRTKSPVRKPCLSPTLIINIWFRRLGSHFAD